MLLAHSRFTTGWYGARLMAVTAALVVLMSMLLAVARLHRQVAGYAHRLREQNLALHEAQQLVPRLQDLPAGPGAQAARGAPPEVELLERIEPCVEVGVRARGASGSLPVERIALGQERRGEGRGPRNAARMALEQETPQSRVHGEPSETLPQRREAPVGHGAEELEQLLRPLQGSGLRSLEPGERRGVGLAEGQQLEHRPREVEAPHRG